MGYIDYKYYTNTYKGSSIPETAFDRIALIAQSKVDHLTFNRINKKACYMEKVKMCCCELAEYLYKQDNKDHEDDVQSDKKGEWSTTYISAKEAEALKQSKIKEIIYSWLAVTGLLYRGCY